MVKAEKLLQKLKQYEGDAYDGGIGCDWYQTIGEDFKRYVQECVEEEKSITMTGFVKRIDRCADDMLQKGDEQQ